MITDFQRVSTRKAYSEAFSVRKSRNRNSVVSSLQYNAVLLFKPLYDCEYRQARILCFKSTI